MSVLATRNLSKKYFGAKRYVVKDLSLEADRGELVALIGESGSGKTTILRMIAGFEIPNSGEIMINSAVVYDRETFVEPEKRGVGMVFQDYALFPHLNIFKNIGFGLYELTRSDKEKRIYEMLELVGLKGYEKHFPHELSGGQQQRVGLARALAPEPSLLLLDEPFNNIDAILKTQIREEVGQIIKQTDTTTIFVTHDKDDALSIADKVAVLRDGEIQQIDTPKNIYTYPRNLYVANLFGKTNILRATVTNGGYDTPVGFIKAAKILRKGSSVILSIRPENFKVVHEEDSIGGEVKNIIFSGEYQEVVLSVKDKNGSFSDLIIYVDSDEQIKIKDTIWVKAKADLVELIR
jgi:iron(III) transport system ATP-binding protein